MPHASRKFSAPTNLCRRQPSRTAYDVKYEENRAITWKVFGQQGASDHRSEDRRLFHAILSLLYIARRRDPQHGGLGSVTLEKPPAARVSISNFQSGT